MTIDFCKKRSSQQCSCRDVLARLVGHLKSQVDLGRLSILGPYNSELRQLENLELESARGAQVRSRAKWVEEGESSSAYFFRLEKKRSAYHCISALRASDNTIVSSVDGLCDTVTSFYSSLFSSEPTDPAACDSLLVHVHSKLPES